VGFHGGRLKDPMRFLRHRPNFFAHLDFPLPMTDAP